MLLHGRQATMHEPASTTKKSNESSLFANRFCSCAAIRMDIQRREHVTHLNQSGPFFSVDNFQLTVLCILSISSLFFSPRLHCAAFANLRQTCDIDAFEII